MTPPKTFPSFRQQIAHLHAADPALKDYQIAERVGCNQDYVRSSLSRDRRRAQKEAKAA